MDDQLDLFPGCYSLGRTKDADDLWTTTGFGGPSIAEFLGLHSEFRTTGKEALEQAASLICVDILAQDISKATLRMKEKKAGGGTTDVDPTRHPMAMFLALDPNRRHTWTEFTAMLVYHMAMASNSYAYAPRSNAGEVLELIPIVPGNVVDRVNRASREIFYDFNARNAHEQALLGTDFLTAPERDVLHVRQRMVNGFSGYSTLLAGRKTLSLARDIEEYERQLFSENGLIRGFFSRPAAMGVMGDEPFRRVKSQLKKLMERVRKGGKDEPILLEDGISFNELAMKATEADMVKALDKQIEMTGKLWRMPPHKTMSLTAVKYENLNAMEMVYVRDTLVPLCKLIEARLARLLLTPQERLRFFFEFDRDEMSISDAKAESDRIYKAVGQGRITINEGRADDGYNPVPWGNARVVPVNTILVDENNNVVASGAKATDHNATTDDTTSDTPAEDDSKKGLRLVASNE